MSKLDELIQELCPDGVEFRKLGEISQYCKERIDASTVDKTCYVGVENLLQNKQGKTLSSAVPTTGQVIAFSFGDILIGNIRPYLKKIWLADCNGGTNGDVLAIHITDSGMLPEFLYYVLSSDSFFHYDMQYAKGSKMPRGSKEAVLQYITPVPPLPVQREIVRILDNFTELTEGLNRELAAELTARKQQYAYYRDKLLAFGDDVPKDTLENLCDFQYGKGNSIPTAPGEYPVYGCNGVVGTTNVFNSIDAPVIGHIGSAGIVNWGKGKHFVTYNGTICKVRPEKMISRYAYHLLCSLHLERFVKGSQPFLSYSDFAKETVAVPPLNIQQRVVSILDRFDTLCTDLSSGLPAEIEARQKQYEYYRDKLLTFTPAD